MRKGRRLARYAAQAESGLRVEVRCFHPPVIEAETLGRRILEIKLAIIAAPKRLRGQPLGGFGRQPVMAIKETAGTARLVMSRI
jgi:hypothetical protein